LPESLPLGKFARLQIHKRARIEPLPLAERPGSAEAHIHFAPNSGCFPQGRTFIGAHSMNHFPSTVAMKFSDPSLRRRLLHQRGIPSKSPGAAILFRLFALHALIGLFAFRADRLRQQAPGTELQAIFVRRMGESPFAAPTESIPDLCADIHMQRSAR
jgi:hypothetical protein